MLKIGGTIFLRHHPEEIIVGVFVVILVGSVCPSIHPSAALLSLALLPLDIGVLYCLECLIWFNLYFRKEVHRGILSNDLLVSKIRFFFGCEVVLIPKNFKSNLISGVYRFQDLSAIA